MRACLALVTVALLVLACGAQKQTPQAVANEAPPKVTNLVQPAYPEPARKAGIEGMVTVQVVVGVTGSVLEGSILKSSGNGSLDSAALAAAKGSTFEPGARDGKPVEMKIAMPFRFKLGDSKGTHTQAPGGWFWTGWPKARLCCGSSSPAFAERAC